MDLIRKAIESKINAMGLTWVKLESFQLNSKQKTVSAAVLLDGEPGAIQFDAAYAVEGDKLAILRVESSRKWITEAAKLALEKTGGKVDLPGGITGRMVRMML